MGDAAQETNEAKEDKNRASWDEYLYMWVHSHCFRSVGRDSMSLVTRMWTVVLPLLSGFIKSCSLTSTSLLQVSQIPSTGFWGN